MTVITKPLTSEKKAGDKAPLVVPVNAEVKTIIFNSSITTYHASKYSFRELLFFRGLSSNLLWHMI